MTALTLSFRGPARIAALVIRDAPSTANCAVSRSGKLRARFEAPAEDTQLVFYARPSRESRKDQEPLLDGVVQADDVVRMDTCVCISGLHPVFFAEL